MNISSEQSLRNKILPSYTLSDGTIANKVIAASFDGGTTLVPITYDNVENPTKLIVNYPMEIENLDSMKVMELYRIEVNGSNAITNKSLIF